MTICPLCNGECKVPDNKVHFGDGQTQLHACPVCRGTGLVQIVPTAKRIITIIKPHGVWQARE